MQTGNVFEAWWAFAAWQESSSLSLDPNDRGNWTSGICGVGQLKGSKFGISAAAFPDADISGMTFESAGQIALSHYWQNDHVNADTLPASVAILLVDAAYGSGPIPAVRTLQRSLGLADSSCDGINGPHTLEAVAAFLRAPVGMPLTTRLDVLLSEFAAERILYESEAGTWQRYRGGWVRRVARSLMLARTFGDAPWRGLEGSQAPAATMAGMTPPVELLPPPRVF